MDLKTLHAFEDEIRQLVPDFQVKFKSESKLQRFIGLLVKPFNPEYLTRYTSTFYPVVWFSSRESYESHPRTSMTVLAHELVHLLDTKAHPIWFRVSYLFPQCLSLMAFATYVALCGWRSWPLAVLLGGLLLSCLLARFSIGAFGATLLVAFGVASTFAVWLGGWHSIAFFAGLILLAPWPAPWRVQWELRGYGMTIAMTQWTYKGVISIVRNTAVLNFIKSSYYYMSWSRTNVEKKLDGYMEQAQDGTLQKQGPYKQVHDFLEKNNLLQ